MYERPSSTGFVHLLCLLLALSLPVHSQNSHLSVHSLHCFFTLPTCNYMIRYSLIGFVLFMLVKIPFLVVRVDTQEYFNTYCCLWFFTRQWN